MSTPAKIAVTLLFFAILGGLGLADFLLHRDTFSPNAIEVAMGGSQDGEPTTDPDDGDYPVFPFGSPPPPPPGSTEIAELPSIEEVIAEQGFTLEQTNERSLIKEIMEPTVSVTSSVILDQGGDRLAFFALGESPSVKDYFLALKEALQKSFSPEVKDLVDTTEVREGHPPRSILTFVDPAIHEEKIIFVRAKERLYEFHVARGKDDTVVEFMNSLTD